MLLGLFAMHITPLTIFSSYFGLQIWLLDMQLIVTSSKACADLDILVLWGAEDPFCLTRGAFAGIETLSY